MSPAEKSAPGTSTGSQSRLPAQRWRTSRLPPVSRGGIVRRPSAASGGTAASGSESATGWPCTRSRSSRARTASQPLVRRRDADDAGEELLRNGHARQLRRARDAVRDLPLDHVRLREEVGEEPEAGDHPGDAEVGGLVGDELDLEHLARLRALDVDRPRQRMPEPEVERGRRRRACSPGSAARRGRPRPPAGSPRLARPPPRARCPGASGCASDQLRHAGGGRAARRDLVLRPLPRASRAGGARRCPAPRRPASPA